MKFLKNFTLISLLLAASVPTETKPSLIALFITALVAIPAAAIYIPYALLTRHSYAENFVTKQEDIESYSIAVETTKNKEKIENIFSGSDYSAVIDDVLTWVEDNQTPRSKVILRPSIKLIENEKIYEMRIITRSTLPKKPHLLKKYFEALEKALKKRFELPGIDSNLTSKDQAAITIANGFLQSPGNVTPNISVPLALASLPTTLCTRYSSAKNFVRRSEDIESYFISVKIKHDNKIILEKILEGSDPQTTISQAIEYAKKEHAIDRTITFESRIQLLTNEKIYALKKITAPTLPKNNLRIPLYWKKLVIALNERFFVPEKTATNTTYTTNLAYFGAIITQSFVSALKLPNN